MLGTLHERHPGLTKALGPCYAEAASVCLNRHHQSPASFTVSGGGPESGVYDVRWEHPSERECRAWLNVIDTTEAGAYCLALAAVGCISDS